VAATWRALSPEQRVAGIAAALLVVSTFGPFSFVELAIALVGVSVLVLLRMRAEGRHFHLPFGDGTVIAAAGLWCGFLIVVRVLDRPLGQNLLALGCALLLFLAGVRERSKRPPDDMPEERQAEEQPHGRHREPRAGETVATRPLRDVDPDRPTIPLADPSTRPLPEDPPEMPHPRSEPPQGRPGP